MKKSDDTSKYAKYSENLQKDLEMRDELNKQFVTAWHDYIKLKRAYLPVNVRVEKLRKAEDVKLLENDESKVKPAEPVKV